MMAKLSEAVNKQDHILGPMDAPVTLVEYGDYQCPSCGEAAPVVQQLVKHYSDKLRFVFRNFPLPQHSMAEPAAEAAEFAASEGKFWPVHDALYAQQEQLGEAFFVDVAKQQGMAPEELLQAVSTQKFKGKIEADLESGEASGLRGTPTFYINGEMFDGRYDYASLKQALDAAGAA